MQPLALLLAAASLGVDYGWQPDKDGHLEYIIQMEPSVLELLKQGQEIVSEIHPDAKGVRRFRLVVGQGKLPRENPPGTITEPAERGVLQPPEVPPETEPEMPLGQPPVRAAKGDARADFQPEIEPGPTKDEPAATPPPAKRRFGKTFGAPATPPDQPSFDALQPDQFDTDPKVTPIKHKQVSHTERLASRDDDKKPAAATGFTREPTDAKSAATPAKVEPAKPWLPLTVTLLLLFGSIGGNAYLAWLAKDFYFRYRALADELRGPRAIEA